MEGEVNWSLPSSSVAPHLGLPLTAFIKLLSVTLHPPRNRLPPTGTRTQTKSSLGLKPTWLGLNPAQTHSTWFQDPVKFRFLVSHHRKNSVRDKVIGKKWFYSDAERGTLHRQSAGHHRGRMLLRNLVWLVFIGWVISYVREREEDSSCFWEGVEISRIWATTVHSLVF